MFVEIRLGSWGVFPEAFPFRCKEVPLPDHLLENPKKQYEPCTVLVVLPAMECGGNLLLNIVAIVGISAECLCWLRLILYFRNVFYTMH